MQEPGPSSPYYAHFAPGADGPIRPPSPPTSPLLGATRGDENDVEFRQSDELYTILNLGRDATEAEIRDRYRSLASTYHPDRQRDEAAKNIAHGRFQEIQRAYEVLSDHRSRIIYDTFGEEGLRTSWELGPRNISPEELRRQFSKRAMESRRLEAEQLIKSKGNIAAVLDARAVWIPISAFPDPTLVKHDAWSRLWRISPGRITTSHSFEVPIRDDTQLIVTGTSNTRAGRGRSNVMGTVKYQFSPRLWGQVAVSLFRPYNVAVAGSYVHDENTFVNFEANAQTVIAPPRTSITVGRKLYANTTGFITYKSGFYSLGPWGASLDPRVLMADQSALTVGLTTTKPDASGWTVETQAGLVGSHMSGDWSTTVMGLKVKIGAGITTEEGITGFIDAEGKATRYIRTGMTLQLQLTGGITMRIKFSRLGQRITIPILLTHDLNPYVLLGATMLPAASYVAAYRYIILPKKRRRLQDRVKELREDNADLIAQKRKEALEAVSIMQGPTAKKAAQEREKNGLVILDAHYGHADCFTDRGLRSLPESEPGQENYIDVTIPVQALVNDSTLVIPGGRGKHNLLGFWDPCIGESKKLRVRYMFRGKIHQVTVEDKVGLRAPMKAHLIDSPN